MGKQTSFAYQIYSSIIQKFDSIKNLVLYFSKEYANIQNYFKEEELSNNLN